MKVLPILFVALFMPLYVFADDHYQTFAQLGGSYRGSTDPSKQAVEPCEVKIFANAQDTEIKISSMEGIQVFERNKFSYRLNEVVQKIPKMIEVGYSAYPGDLSASWSKHLLSLQSETWGARVVYNPKTFQLRTLQLSFQRQEAGSFYTGSVLSYDIGCYGLSRISADSL